MPAMCRVMEKNLTATLTVFTRSDLYVATLPPSNDEHEEYDPEPREYAAYYVVAELPTGERWAHCVTFKGHEMGDAQAAVAAARLAERVSDAIFGGTWAGPDAANLLGVMLWHPVQPCYGSEAYSRNAGRYAAEDDLADGNFDPGTRREHELRARAAA